MDSSKSSYPRRLTHIKIGNSAKPKNTQISSTPHPVSKPTEDFVMHKHNVHIDVKERKEFDDFELPRPALKAPKPTAVPNFLKKDVFKNSNDSDSSIKDSIANKVFGRFTGESGLGSAINSTKNTSFSSVFNSDQSQTKGVKRVFQKSIFAMIFNLCAFGLLAFSGVSLFSIPVWLVAIFAISYVVSSHIFFIIVADRSYVWLSLVGSLILLLLVYGFIGQSFNPISLIFTFLTGLLIYLAYTELEKSQLSSRLFSVGQVTTEANRILATVTFLVLTLGLFNHLTSSGFDNFFRKEVLNNEYIFRSLILGDSDSRGFGLNRFVVNGSTKYGEGNTTATLANFLVDNYKDSKPVITEAEQNQIIQTCQIASIGAECGNAALEERNKRLDAWRKERYPTFNYPLSTIIDGPKYTELTKLYYSNIIRDFSQGDSSNSFVIIPRSQILPALVCILFFIILTFLRPIFAYLTYLFTLLMWQFLKTIGVVRIDVETVEAEIVSI